MKRFKIAGIGEMIFDHHFVDKQSNIVYFSSRGGGSVWNVLANLSQSDVNIFAIGVFGEDNLYGTIAKQELDTLGINTKYIKGIKNKYSRIIFETLHQGSPDNPHSFTDKCIVCAKRPIDNKIARLMSFPDLTNTLLKEDFDIVILDRLTKDRSELVRNLREKKPEIISIIDVGRISYLRFVPTNQIISYLNEFDIVFINSSNALNPLLKRLKAKDRTEYLQSVLNKGKTKVIIVTKGEDGYDIIFKDKSFTEKAINFECTNDAAGAGDAFLSYFVSNALLFGIENVCNTDIIINSLKKSALEIGRVLKEIGARGHLPIKVDKDIPTNKYLGLSIESIKSDIGNNLCPFCFLKNDNKRKNEEKRKPHKGSISKTIADLSSRFLFTFERTFAIDQCKEIVQKSGTIYVIGTGGSYISAFFISQVLNQMGNSFSIPIRPLDYLSLVKKKSDVLVILTYSGSTLDYEPVIKKGIDLGVETIYIITHSPAPKLARLLPLKNSLFDTSSVTKGIVINYSSEKSKKEKGFISMAGILSPSVLFLIASLNSNVDSTYFNSILKNKKSKQYYNLNEIASSIRNNQALEVYGGGMSWSAMLDLESKLIEGGVCAVQLHEFKDFSHGRFMFSLRNKLPKIILQVDEDPYIDKLIQILKDYEKSFPVIVIKSDEVGLLGSLELLIEMQYFIHKLINIIFDNNKTDITRPKNVPSNGLELYRWKLDF